MLVFFHAATKTRIIAFNFNGWQVFATGIKPLPIAVFELRKLVDLFYLRRCIFRAIKCTKFYLMAIASHNFQAAPLGVGKSFL